MQPNQPQKTDRILYIVKMCYPVERPIDLGEREDDWLYRINDPEPTQDQPRSEYDSHSDHSDSDHSDSDHSDSDDSDSDDSDSEDSDSDDDDDDDDDDDGYNSEDESGITDIRDVKWQTLVVADDIVRSAPGVTQDDMELRQRNGIDCYFAMDDEVVILLVPWLLRDFPFENCIELMKYYALEAVKQALASEPSSNEHMFTDADFVDEDPGAPQLYGQVYDISRERLRNMRQSQLWPAAASTPSASSST